MSQLNDILDFSKIEAGKLDIELSNLMWKYVCQCMANITSRAAEKKSQITFKANPKLPAYLIGDPLRISQLLLNRSNNALSLPMRDGEYFGDFHLMRLQIRVRLSSRGRTPAYVCPSRTAGKKSVQCHLPKLMAQLKSRLWWNRFGSEQIVKATSKIMNGEITAES